VAGWASAGPSRRRPTIPGLLTLTGRALSVDELAARYRIDVTS
jgi:hypothetical protein